MIYENGAYVGIGTTFPGATLDVNGAVNTSTTFNLNNSPILSIGGVSDQNLFVGTYAGRNNTPGQGQSNTFTGYMAGYSDTTGSANAAYGTGAGFSISSGFHNSFFGSSSGVNTTSGFDNTVMGYKAGNGITVGNENTYIGIYSGYSGAGNGNAYLGEFTGPYNTGSWNTFIGSNAGAWSTGGNNNIYLGNPGCNSPCTESNTIRIGYGGGYSAYIDGIYGTNVGGIPVQINSNGQLGAATSSIRFKEQIRDMGDSTDALMKLRPVTYFYKPEYADGERTLQYGLIAEEVAKVYPELVAYDKAGEPYSVRYQYLSTMLLNEVQKQYHRAEAEVHVIQLQEQRISDLEQRLSQLETLMGSQARTLAQK
jgi:hypothetical protein